MRKRSGGLHSDSSEEFMLLAEYAHEKTGYYYDEDLHKEVKQKLKSKFKRTSSQNEPVGPHVFEGFDFGTQDEEAAEESQELWAHSHTIEVNIVLICAHPHNIRSKLEQIWPQSNHAPPSPDKRALDLFVHTLKHESQHVHCYKFWILDAAEADNLIYNSYLKRAKKILRFGQGSSDWLPESQAKGVIFSCVSALAD